MNRMGLNDIEKIYTIRKGYVKLTCTFCERRCGWFTPIKISEFINNFGVIACSDCRSRVAYERNLG